MGRSPCCDESGLKKGPWTPEEDDKLVKYIQKHGHGSWRALPKLAGLNRCGKSCRLRWTNYLRPDIKRGKFSQEEEQTILNLHAILGNKWSAIATHLLGRTDNEIKNFWNTHLKKKLIHMGIDPMTHRPRTDVFSTLPQLIALANLIDNPSAWEGQALQMARLNQYCLNYLLHPPPAVPISATFQNPTASIASDMANFNLLNSLKAAADPSILSQFETVPPPSMGFLQDSDLPFSHLPDLKNACSMQTNCKGSENDLSALLNQGENSPGSSSSPWMPHSAAAAPPLVETSNVTNNGDACSTSSYGGAQLWSELFLEDPIFHDIA